MNPYILPTEEIERLRAEAVEGDRKDLVQGQKAMLDEVDFVVDYLVKNREHISAIGLIVVAYDNTILIDPTDGDASNGMTSHLAAHEGYRLVLSKRAEAIAKNQIPSRGVEALLRAIATTLPANEAEDCDEAESIQ